MVQLTVYYETSLNCLPKKLHLIHFMIFPYETYSGCNSDEE